MPDYCSAQDVVDFLRILGNDGNLLQVGANTDPAEASVNALIEQNEDILDQRLGHAYREATATDEIHDIPRVYEWNWGNPIHLANREVRQLSYDAGDRIGLWNGIRYDDMTQGEGTLWRANYKMGIIYMVGYAFVINRENRIRITYRYGASGVPGWLKRAAIKLTAVDLIETSLSMSKIQTQEGVNVQQLVQQWRADVDDAIFKMQDVKVVEF